MFEQKQKDEKAFGKWASKKDEYKNLLADVDKTFAAYKPYALQSTYLREGIMAPTIIKLASYAASLEETMAKNDASKTQAAKKQLLESVEDLPYEQAIVDADKRIFDSILVLYYNNIPKDQQVPYFKDVILTYGTTPDEAIKAYTEYVFENSMFASTDMTKGFIKNPRLKMLKNDIAYKHLDAFRSFYNKTFKPKVDEFTENSGALSRLYIKGLMEMNPTKEFYPDANSSMRLTYGTVKSYMKFPLITNLDEVMAKNQNNPGSTEFSIPDRLRELHKNKDYGMYAMKDGKLPVAFLSDNDITGGNSGSPVIDGEGRIIGLAFDGNWEAMSGNIHFDPKNKRTINVDIRYVLFLIDKYGQASNIINELTIVK